MTQGVKTCDGWILIDNTTLNTLHATPLLWMTLSRTSLLSLYYKTTVPGLVGLWTVRQSGLQLSRLLIDSA